MPTAKSPRLNPNKLLLSKWTAVTPQNKEKHFIVSKLLLPDDPDAPLEMIELEAVFSKRVQIMPWRDLRNTDNWRQGWH
ncbi:TIGR02450 family Trp-rich protein [Methylomonas sp. EbB]|uniref:TIGR02450 family Trp-rich protein n=2 Tax=Methylomonas fluvii TaxID=1854564 RepID=A0ABR9D8A5_9GAMM|nr:TIGR02450 family Trp-rich protein [Methylomonas fluvii]